ncbi:TetR/AcrR family transcriptional regulator [Marinobacter sp. SS21]|uniref:TetR/AcrR family transcriptional regulator n=1 Tax=Marinobacter sp. SS21 TaxID=2979460 RepID=UPI00232C3D1E|nr:TetR/AcrR family transcriptional regulator [Marinobacter sp. SS21]MDC0661115.1 TetR/AcrR family transcriptional regulator [Marinobacter sp. SS21]
MRYPANHKAHIHKQLVESAGALVKTQGFGTTGVDALMASVGLTGGAFYGHFKSKVQLFREIIANELGKTRDRFQGLSATGDRPRSYHALVTGYFSRQHLERADSGCPLPSLSSEVARADDEVKRAYEAGLLELHAILTEQVGDEAKAWAVIAMGAGAINLGRAVQSPALQEELLAACRQVALGQTRD